MSRNISPVFPLLHPVPLTDIENGSGDVGDRLLDDCNGRFFDYNWAEFGKTKAAVKLHTLI